MNRYRTSEYVGIGHPDKVADQISDTVLDMFLADDPNARVAAETLVSGNKVIIAGEVASPAPFGGEDIERNVRQTLEDIGYGPHVPGGFNSEEAQIEILLKPQSANIHSGVDKEDGDVGAGDQGIMFGYAVNETEYYLPLPYVISAELLNILNQQILIWGLEGFYTDNKSQTCVRYKTHEGISVADKFIEKIILSCWHKESMDIGDVRIILEENVIKPVLNKYQNYLYEEDEVELHINSAGPFFIGGPVADAGLTGRKIIVDTYGGFAPHGGGAFSGKDPSKVDRSAAYMARHIAKSLVINGYAYEALVQLSYAIGETQPFSIDIKSDSQLPEEQLVKMVRDNFDLSPKGIINYLELNDSNVVKYKTVASGGHFLDPTLPWEQIRKF